jgi:histidine ammonia-lyase
MVTLDGKSLTPEEVEHVAWGAQVQIASSARQAVVRAHDALSNMVSKDEVIYGVNTGFGSLMSKVLPAAELQRLSRNTLLSHAIAVGKPMSKKRVRAGMVVRLNSLIIGRSGVSPELVDLLCASSIGRASNCASWQH